MHQKPLGSRAPPDPLATVNRLQPPGGGRGKGKEGMGEGREGKEGEGRGGDGKGGKGKGEMRGREGVHNLRKTTPRQQMAGYGPVVTGSGGALKLPSGGALKLPHRSK